jgi:hypothetical protein
MATTANITLTPSYTTGSVTVPLWNGSGTSIYTTSGASNYTLSDITTAASYNIRGLKITDDDIEFNGKSLIKMLETMSERLAILEPNPKLEEEFAQLREVREKYHELEKALIEKKKMWDILKKDS